MPPSIPVREANTHDTKQVRLPFLPVHPSLLRGGLLALVILSMVRGLEVRGLEVVVPARFLFL